MNTVFSPCYENDTGEPFQVCFTKAAAQQTHSPLQESIANKAWYKQRCSAPSEAGSSLLWLLLQHIQHTNIAFIECYFLSPIYVAFGSPVLKYSSNSPKFSLECRRPNLKLSWI